MASAHDRKVINSILNPTLPLGEGVHDDVEEDARELRDPEEEDTEEIRYKKGAPICIFTQPSTNCAISDSKGDPNRLS